MICNNCGKDFHYCPSCGWIPEAEAGCCSIACTEEWKTKLIENQDWKTIAEHFCQENQLFVHDDRFTESGNKQKLGVAIVDHIIENL